MPFTPSSLSRLGVTVIEIVARDVAEHGEEVIAALRQQNPAAYAFLGSLALLGQT